MPCVVWVVRVKIMAKRTPQANPPRQVILQRVVPAPSQLPPAVALTQAAGPPGAKRISHVTHEIAQW
jgi:hypothetical protein